MIHRPHYHVFIAHASKDRGIAKRLHNCLRRRGARVVLDEEFLSPGDPWDEVLERAQADSLLTAVIVSPHTEDAFFQREEIVRAIALSRDPRRHHKVVPVVLPRSEPGYGLKRLHAIYVRARKDGALLLTEAAEKIMRLLDVTEVVDNAPIECLVIENDISFAFVMEETFAHLKDDPLIVPTFESDLFVALSRILPRHHEAILLEPLVLRKPREAVRTVRARTGDTPLILLTGWDDADTIGSLLRDGLMDDILVKGEVGAAGLVSTIRDLVAARRSAARPAWPS